jgi:hypothetical protein
MTNEKSQIISNDKWKIFSSPAVCSCLSLDPFPTCELAELG